MPLVCIQCALEDYVNGTPARVWDEEIADHLRREHPDSAETKAERARLMRLAHQKMKQTGETG